jgi:hypothetical protein
MLWPQQAAATEWRGCRGEIGIHDDRHNFVSLWQFEGRGSCKNRAHANDCRRAARGAIVACAQEAWRTRWDRRLPDVCRPVSGRAHVKGIADTFFGRGPGAEGAQDFKWAVERAACCQMHRDSDRVAVRVGVSSHGDKGCQREEPSEVGEIGVLLDNYTADCRAVRARGVCR